MYAVLDHTFLYPWSFLPEKIGGGVQLLQVHILHEGAEVDLQEGPDLGDGALPLQLWGG